jgi:hypothetical protein
LLVALFSPLLPSGAFAQAEDAFSVFIHTLSVKLGDTLCNKYYQSGGLLGHHL